MPASGYAMTVPTDASGRLERVALQSHLRQELGAPVYSILEFAAILLEDARRLELHDARQDLLRVQAAGEALSALIDNCIDLERHAHEGDFEQFCATLRHDLRTPLNAIKGYGEMLLEDAVTGDGAVQALAPDLQQIVTAVNHLLEIIPQIVRSDTPTLASRAGSAQDANALVDSVVRTLDLEKPPGGPLTLGHILVVDDNPHNRQILCRRLLRDGHRVTTAEDGLAALEAVTRDTFDLILLDLMMPGLNGFEVLLHLKRSDQLKGIPVIMISALDEISSIVRCIEYGAEDFLNKPFDPVLLRARIGACLEKKRLRDLEQLYRANVERELQTAAGIQMGILPSVFPPVVGVNGHGLMVPAKEVGGDFFDFIPLGEGRVGIAVGDVSGKGLPAALFMAISRTLLRTTALFGLSPGECLTRVNELLASENDQAMFVTLFFGIVDSASGTLTYANGGHAWPLLMRAGKAAEWLPGTDGAVVGIVEGLKYQEACVPFEPDDLCFLYSDGVVEAIDPAGAEFTSERLFELLSPLAQHNPQAVAEAILEQVNAFAGHAPQFDDITCVAIRRVEA
jgi:phosphoserine phosphatase RsbU/P